MENVYSRIKQLYNIYGVVLGCSDRHERSSGYEYSNVRRIEDSDDAIAITKNGVPEAVLISMKKFKGLMETLEILADEKAMKSIRKSIKEARKDVWLDFDKVFGE